MPPTGPIEPVVEDGWVRNAGGTILGGDNKAAVVAMLEAVRRVREEGRPHAGIELVFTPKEEVGLLGATAFDETRLEARVGFVYDQQGPVGEIVLGAPTQRSLAVRFHGRAAHAGMVPEEGRSAIAAAARAIADLRLGRLDDETSANVGLISRRDGAQHRPGVVHVRGGGAGPRRAAAERRRRRDARRDHLRGERRGLRGRDDVQESYRGYRFQPRRPRACGSPRPRSSGRGTRRRYALTGGGADANVFNERGLQCVNLANGMTDIHTPTSRSRSPTSTRWST